MKKSKLSMPVIVAVVFLGLAGYASVSALIRYVSNRDFNAEKMDALLSELKMKQIDLERKEHRRRFLEIIEKKYGFEEVQAYLIGHVEDEKIETSAIEKSRDLSKIQQMLLILSLAREMKDIDQAKKFFLDFQAKEVYENFKGPEANVISDVIHVAIFRALALLEEPSTAFVFRGVIRKNAPGQAGNEDNLRTEPLLFGEALLGLGLVGMPGPDNRNLLISFLEDTEALDRWSLPQRAALFSALSRLFPDDHAYQRMIIAELKWALELSKLKTGRRSAVYVARSDEIRKYHFGLKAGKLLGLYTYYILTAAASKNDTQIRDLLIRGLKPEKGRDFGQEAAARAVLSYAEHLAGVEGGDPDFKAISQATQFLYWPDVVKKRRVELPTANKLLNDMTNATTEQGRINAIDQMKFHLHRVIGYSKSKETQKELKQKLGTLAKQSKKLLGVKRKTREVFKNYEEEEEALFAEWRQFLGRLRASIMPEALKAYLDKHHYNEEEALPVYLYLW